jgi:hypothetical protein
VLAVLLAHDVGSWRSTLRGDAIRYSVSPTAQLVWTAPTDLPPSTSARLLGVARDRQRLSALRFFALSVALDTSNGATPADEALLQKTEAILSQVAQDANPAIASQAYELLGIVLFKDERGGFTQDVATYSSSITAMQNAVRVDPTNKQAEADLELLLRQFDADRQNSDQQQANNQGSRPKGKTVGRGKGIPPLKTPSGDY